MPSFLRRIVSLPSTAEHVAAPAATEESRPEALPSRLAKKFGNAPFMGTVVVDEHFPGLADLESKMAQSVFELVEPEVASSCSTPASSSAEKSGEAKTRRIVRQGGFVLFSAAYLKANPNSAAARLAQSYANTFAYNGAQQKEELENMKLSPVAADADESEKTEAAKLAAVQREVYAADLGCLPMFRYRNDDDVYGRACYTRRSATPSTTSSRNSPVVAPSARPCLAQTAFSSVSSLCDSEESDAEHIVASPTNAAGKMAFPEVHAETVAHTRRVAMTA